MTFQISHNKSRLEYFKKQDTKIITILGFTLDDIKDLSLLLRRLELLAKRSKIKEIWIPIEFEPLSDMAIKLETLSYKRCILGVHEASKEQLKGFKKVINYG